MVELEIGHAIWDTFTYQKGKGGDDRELRMLLERADNTLDRNPGYFFAPVKDLLVFGFENRRAERRGTEAFFDLYFIPLEHAEHIDLRSLYRFLDDRRVTSFDRDIHPTIRYEIAPTQTGQDVVLQGQDRDLSNQDDSGVDTSSEMGVSEFNGDTSDSEFHEWGFGSTEESMNEGSSVDSSQSNLPVNERTSGEQGPDYTAIAAIWDAYRSGGGTVYATFDQAAEFVQVVDGALRHIRFISDARAGTQNFHIVGKRPVQSDQVDDNLAHRIRQQADSGTLEWSNLPTYEDELEILRSQRAENLKGRLDYNSELKEIFQNAYLEATEEVDRHTEQAAKKFNEAATGKLELDEDGGRFVSKLGGMLGDESEGGDVEPILRQVSTETVEEEMERALAEELVEDVASAVTEEITQQVLDSMEQDLQNLLDEKAQQVAVETIEELDVLKQSRTYRLATNDD